MLQNGKLQPSGRMPATLRAIQIASAPLRCGQFRIASALTDEQNSGRQKANVLRNRGFSHYGRTVFRLFVLFRHWQLQDRGALSH
jgi:hypothetical protein